MSNVCLSSSCTAAVIIIVRPVVEDLSIKINYSCLFVVNLSTFKAFTRIGPRIAIQIRFKDTDTVKSVEEFSEKVIASSGQLEILSKPSQNNNWTYYNKYYYEALFEGVYRQNGTSYSA